MAAELTKNIKSVTARRVVRLDFKDDTAAMIIFDVPERAIRIKSLSEDDFSAASVFVDALLKNLSSPAAHDRISERAKGIFDKYAFLLSDEIPLDVMNITKG